MTKRDKSASIKSSFGLLVEVLWIFKDFSILFIVNMVAFNANIKIQTLTGKNIKSDITMKLHNNIHTSPNFFLLFPI